MSVYFLARIIPYFECRIKLNKSSEKQIPMKVIIIDKTNVQKNTLQEYMEAATLLFSPREFEINEVHPATTPIPAEIIKKYNVKDFAKAAKASEEIWPA